ncbi:short coiled-coil protein B-like isoform X2 [Amphiura filiformis]
MSAGALSPATPGSDDGMASVPLGERENGQGLVSDIRHTGGSNGDLPSTLRGGDFSPDADSEDAEEKARLICQVLELQNTLDDLSVRVDKVKEENLKLKSENQVLGQYIENLMSASSVFQSTSPKNKKK